MKLILKWTILLFVALATIIAAYATYRTWEISNRPNPAVAWWEYEVSNEPIGIQKIPILRSFIWRDSYGPHAKYRLWAADETGTIIWSVLQTGDKNAAQRFLSVPQWAFIQDNSLVMRRVIVSQNLTKIRQYFVSVNLKSGKIIEINNAEWEAPSHDNYGYLAHDSEGHFGDNYAPCFYSSYIVVSRPSSESNFKMILNSRNMDLYIPEPDLPIGDSDIEKADGLLEPFTIGYEGILVTTRFDRIPGIENPSPWSRTAIIDYHEATTSTPISSFYVFVRDSGNQYEPIIVGADDFDNYLPKVSFEAAVYSRCIVPRLNDGTSLFFLSTLPGRGAKYAESRAFIAKINAETKYSKVIELPQSFDRYRPKWEMSRFIKSWYNSEENAVFVLMGPHRSHWSTIYRIDDDMNCKKVYEGKQHIQSSLTIGADGAIWFLRMNSPYSFEEPSHDLVRYDPSTNTEIIVMTNLSRTSLYGSYLGSD